MHLEPFRHEHRHTQKQPCMVVVSTLRYAHYPRNICRMGHLQMDQFSELNPIAVPENDY